jgi:hypothetical protein
MKDITLKVQVWGSKGFQQMHSKIYCFFLSLFKCMLINVTQKYRRKWPWPICITIPAFALKTQENYEENAQHGTSQKEFSPLRPTHAVQITSCANHIKWCQYDNISRYDQQWPISSDNLSTQRGKDLLLTLYFLMRFEDLIAVSTKLTVFWVGESCSLVFYWLIFCCLQYHQHHQYHPDDGGSKNLWNVDNLLPDDMVHQLRRQSSFLYFLLSQVHHLVKKFLSSGIMEWMLMYRPAYL